MIHGLELLPSLCEVDGGWVISQFAGLHLNEGEILQVQTTVLQVEEGGVEWNEIVYGHVCLGPEVLLI